MIYVIGELKIELFSYDLVEMVYIIIGIEIVEYDDM